MVASSRTGSSLRGPGGFPLLVLLAWAAWPAAAFRVFGKSERERAWRVDDRLEKKNVQQNGTKQMEAMQEQLAKLANKS